MTTRIPKFAALLGLIALLLAACDASSCTGNVAVINGHAITKRQYQTLLRYTLNFYEWGEPNSEYYSHNICGMEVFAKACRAIKKSLLTRMIDEELVREYASSHHLDLTKADRAQVIVEENALKRKLGGNEGFQAFLQKLQTSMAEFRRIELQQILTTKVENAVVPQSLSGPQVYVRQIFIPIGGSPLAPATLHQRYARAARAKAEWLLNRIRAGANFGKLARQYSGDPLSRKNGGYLGWISQEAGDPTFTKAVFNVPKGRVSLVQWDLGYSVVQVLDRQILPYSGQALATARQHAFVAWLHRQMKSAKITRCSSTS
jgi:hypothetical protein